MRTTAAALAVMALMTIVPAAAQAGELDWRAESSPFRLTYLLDGRALTAQVPGARMRYTLSDGSVHALTRLLSRDGARYRVATDEPGRTATVTVRRTTRGLRVEWSLQPSEGVVQVHEALTGTTRDHFLGAGMHAMYVDLAGQVTPIKTTFVGAGAQSTCNASGSVTPFYLSSTGYGLYADTTAIGRFAFAGAREAPDPPGCQTAPPAPPPPPCPITSGANDRTQLCFKSDHLDYEVYAGDPRQIADAYTAIAGRPALPPKNELALMKWRDTVHGTAEVLEDVDRLQAAGIPLGTLWIDNPWEIENAPPEQVSAGTSCIGTLTFDPAMFPDPQAMIDYVHGHGVRFGLWTAPFYRPQVNGKPCPPPDYPPGSFVDDPFRTDRLDVDLTNPAAYDHFKRKLENVFRLGVDMVKGDRGEETNFEPLQFFAGPGVQYQNLYPQLYAKAVTEVLRDLHGDDFETLFRAGFSGSPRILHGCWGADETTTFEGLRLAVRLGLTSAWSCHPVWGSDTGGYTATDRTVDPTPALFTRWAQFSAVSPVFEVGGQGRNATPWTYDADTVRRFRDAAVLHYELFPYLYDLARTAARTGAPILRPLGFEHPQDDEAWKADQQLLIGPDLLAAPVTADRAEQDGAAGRPTPVDVYLPAGRWIDLFSGEVVRGGRHVTRQTSLDEFPLYLRAGALIPFNLRTPDVWAQPWGVNDLDRAGRAGWMYAPDSDRVSLDLRDAPRETQLLVLAREAPLAVRIDGRDVAQAPSLAALREARRGWTFAGGPFGGVVVKLDGPARVEIDARH